MDGLNGFTHRYAEVNGTRLHYVIGGRGPAVVLLHGFPYSWETWRAVMPRLAKAGYAVLALDLRGMGDSAPAAGYAFAKTNVAQDVRAIVQSLGSGRDRDKTCHHRDRTQPCAMRADIYE